MLIIFQGKFPFIKFGPCLGNNKLEEKSQKVEVRVVSDGSGEASGDLRRFEEISIGRIIIGETTTWKELETLISQHFKQYIKHTYTYCDLGLSTESLHSWEIRIPLEEETILFKHFKDWKKNKSEQNNNKPLHFFTDEYQNRILIYLKGAAQGAVDGLSFQTQIPKMSILKHVHALEKKGRLVLCGPRFLHNRVEIGFVAKKLAEYILVKNDLKMLSPTTHFSHYDVNDPKDKVFKRGVGLQAFLEDIKVRCKEKQGVGPPHAVLIENLQAVLTGNLTGVMKEVKEFRECCGGQVPFFFLGTFVSPSIERQLTHTYYGAY